MGEQLISECEKVVKGENVSQLTLMQYEMMSHDEKVRLNNHIRQWALKVHELLLHEHGLFCLVVAHLLKNAHRYFKIDGPSDFQQHVKGFLVHAQERKYCMNLKKLTRNFIQ